MTASLEGPRLKLDRAWKHLEDLEEIRDSLVNAEAKKITIEHQVNAEGQSSRLWIIENSGVPPPELGPIISDLLHNLRSALDHTATQLVIANGKDATNDTGFPIHGSIREYVKDGLPKIERMSEGVQTEIEAAQPYHGPHRKWITHPLQLLNRWNNIYKHREFKLTVLSIEGGGGYSLPDNFVPFFGTLEGRTIVAEWPNEDPEMEVGYQPLFDVVMADGRWGDQRVYRTMRSLWNYVNKLCAGLADIAGIEGVTHPGDPLPPVISWRLDDPSWKPHDLPVWE